MKKALSLFAICWLAASPVFSQTGKGVSPISSNSTTSSNSTRAVVIGISDYQDAAIPDLRFANKDAEAFANYLRSPAGGGLDNDHLKVLTNQNATAGRVAEALDNLIEQAKEGDQVIIYFSGHGDVEGKKISQPGFLLCWDAPSRVYMGGGTYSLSFLQEVVTTLSVQSKAKVLVITDACHAGKLAGVQIGGAQLTTANLAKQFANEVKILSCQPNEFSLEGEQWGGGRGVFSYHLVDGLFGLADKNGDGAITVGEIDRYLEDKVTAEAAPQSQVPMLLGNKTERLASVNAAVLAALQKAKASGLPVFAATEGRGFEEEVLGKADSSVRQLYFSFKKAVREKRFFSAPPSPPGGGEPRLTQPGNGELVGERGSPPSGGSGGASADELFAQLTENQSLAPLRGMMKRNYAAALQDDAQQAMNIWLKADVQQLECIGKSLRLEPIPRQLARAAELLGEGHYMYRSLQARRLLFEGILLIKHNNPDESLGRKSLSLFRQSLALEAQSPLPWHRMSVVYTWHLRQPDSAFICARQARDLAPNWVLPLADLAYGLSNLGNMELANQALEEAEAIDSLHPYVTNYRAAWFYKLGGRANQEKAVALFEKYRQSGGPVFPCWFNDYGIALFFLGNYAGSELKFKEAIALDSTRRESWNNLGALLTRAGRFADAEPVLKKVVALDPTYAQGWGSLGFLYIHNHRYAEAEPALKKFISLDTTFFLGWNNLGWLYIISKRYEEAEQVLKKAIALDSTSTFPWGNLGYLYGQTRRYAEAEQCSKKGIALDSTNSYAWLGLGIFYLKTNNPKEARQAFNQVIKFKNNYSEAMLGMAYLLFSEGKTEEALGQVEQAIGMGSTFEELESDEELAPLRSRGLGSEWKALMKKHFPDKVKD